MEYNLKYIYIAESLCNIYPAPLARPAMQGPAGNSSHSLTGGPPSTVASGAGRCESGALMHSFGIFLQGLLGVVAFSTLMRESGTPALPEALRLKLLAHRPPGPSCLRSSGLGPFDEGSLLARAQAGHSQTTGSSGPRPRVLSSSSYRVSL